MTTKTRNVVIIIALLLVIFAFILSAPFSAEDDKESLNVRLVEGVGRLFGGVERLEAMRDGPGPRSGESRSKRLARGFGHQDLAIRSGP